MIEALEEYRQHRDREGRAGSSTTTTLIRLRNWLPGHLTLTEIKPTRLEATYRKRTEEVSVDTHRNELGEVKAFFAWACSRGYLRQSPAAGIRPVGKRRCRGEDPGLQLTRSEARRFLRVALERRDWAAVASLVALGFGLRASEILRLRGRDVDWDGEGVVLYVWTGKSRQACRKIPASGTVAGVLSWYARRTGEEALLFPRSRHTLRQAVNRLCRAAGVPEVGPHGLRRTWSTLATLAGAQAFDLARVAGHASAETTRRHYIQPGAGDALALTVLEGGRKG